MKFNIEGSDLYFINAYNKALITKDNKLYLAEFNIFGVSVFNGNAYTFNKFKVNKYNKNTKPECIVEIDSNNLPESGENIQGHIVHSDINPLHGYLLKLQEKENNISNINSTKHIKYLNKDINSTVIYYKDDIKNMSKDDLIEYNNSIDLENEIEYRYILMFIESFGNLEMYGYEYSTEERMENYKPALFI